eukprot:SAG25_NODE_2390_length_1659_cov_1.944872_1_plen_170_part_10
MLLLLLLLLLLLVHRRCRHGSARSPTTARPAYMLPGSRGSPVLMGGRRFLRAPPLPVLQLLLVAEQVAVVAVSHVGEDGVRVAVTLLGAGAGGQEGKLRAVVPQPARQIVNRQIVNHKTPADNDRQRQLCITRRTNRARSTTATVAAEGDDDDDDDDRRRRRRRRRSPPP